MHDRLLAMGVAIGLAIIPAWAAVVPSRPASSTAPAVQPGPPDAQRVRQMVRQLNHPSPARRKAALRQLAAWGPYAFDELSRAAAGPDHEAALSSQSLLTELRSAILIGGQVSLEVDRPRIAWNESFALIVRVKNPTSTAISVPWPQPPADSTTQPADTAAQVGRLLDAAEFLTVTGPDDQPVDLRFEPIDGDPAVYDTVTLRAGKHPPSSQVPPGAEVVLRAVRFNRGWARFPLLAAGTYRIEFAYQPQWKDPSWIEEGFGRVQASPVTVEVLNDAPEEIRHATRPMALKLIREPDLIRAQLVSTWDLPLYLNLSWGPDPTRYAGQQWRFKLPGATEEQSWENDSQSPQTIRRAPQLRRIDPGQTVEIARLSPTDLRGKVSMTGPCEVSARYVNLISASQLRDQAAASGGTAAIPSPLFTGSLVSEPIQVDWSGSNR